MSDRVQEARDEVDGAEDAFMARVRWYYSMAPECLEARRHSFRRQRDMAFTLALRERISVERSATLAEVRRAVEGIRVVHTAECNANASALPYSPQDEVCVCEAATHNKALAFALTALDRMEATDA